MPDNEYQWEKVTPGTERLRVPGGWLYMVMMEAHSDLAFSLAYVPDPATFRETLLRAVRAIQ